MLMWAAHSSGSSKRGPGLNMLTRAWRLRVAPVLSAAAAPRCSLWGLPLSRGLSSSSDESPLVPKKRVQETAKERKIRQAREFPLLPQLLTIYKQATGHFIVPYHFPIPPLNPIAKSEGKNNKKRQYRYRFPGLVCGLVGDVRDIQWPDTAKGMNFGRAVDTFWRSSEHQRDFPEVTRALMEMGLLQSGETRHQFEWREQTMPALRVFYDIYGDSIVPQDFMVPRDDVKWPVPTMGLRLGLAVFQIRRESIKQKLPAQELADLQAIEFSFDVYETTWSEKVLPSLKVFAQVFGHCSVPAEFVVPKTEPWPPKAWGFDLGRAVHNIRSKQYFVEQIARHAHILDAIKFVWDHDEHQWSERVLPSLETFYGRNGHCAVPKACVVPSEEPWPKVAWGLKLGITVDRMRSIGIFAKQVARDAARLEAIEFSWNAIQDRWSKRVLPAFETFYRNHGHCDVPWNFVVPSEDPWPKLSWSLKLGFAYRNIKNRGDYAEQRVRDRSQLEAISFLIKK